MEARSERVRIVNRAPVREDGAFVLYWMVAARRANHNFALDHALAAARRLGKPLIVLEALRCDYRWASDRLHAFIIEGMRDNAARFARTCVAYHPFVERHPGEGRGLLEALGRRAAVVVTDDAPVFFLPRAVEAAGRRLRVRLEAVDGNGLVPLRAADRVYPTARGFRHFLHGQFPRCLERLPAADPLRRVRLPRAVVPPEVSRRWPAADCRALLAAGGLAGLPIDHGVGRGLCEGGSRAARAQLDVFLLSRLHRYEADRACPSIDATSGLSPWLHFGHIATQEIVSRLCEVEGFAPARLEFRAAGRREGFFGMSPAAEAFLDQLLTWRELGFNMAWQRDDCDTFESLPAWAQATLRERISDPREYVYDPGTFRDAGTHDALWNAAERQLVREGRLHNHARMLWGKKVLEWTATPEDALQILVELNNRFALDGRDPNSISGIFWCLGRYDRAFGPRRPVLGTVRYMSSANFARKVRVKEYLGRYGP